MSRAPAGADGIVNLLKPAGMSSHDAVDFLRRISGTGRVGHTGTLDPMAVGVLPLCVGKGTRITEYLAADRKRYRCEMRLGIATDTQDVWGRVNFEAESGFIARLTERMIAETAGFFVGPQMQTPPAYSAVKIGGKKLYEYARAGKTVDIPARGIEIFSLDIKRIDMARGLVVFEAECSKGTYMRTLCHDMGRMLGCGAAMSGLLRTASGIFALEDAHTVEALEAAFSSDALPGGILTALDAPLGDFPAVTLHSEEASAFSHGMRVKTSTHDAARQTAGARALCRVYGDTDRRGRVFLGVGRFGPDALRAEKVLREL
ncbi:MAG: tRNA pseudouridine(55) synthase TruB [Clostridiales Family XIII bacterium]|jgi:tRNA pseudouridine55 synthase|nr:tRNA pseudouridine(55) synthase TruB [Clostridiales Family XIII bacterium]